MGTGDDQQVLINLSVDQELDVCFCNSDCATSANFFKVGLGSYFYAKGLVQGWRLNLLSLRVSPQFWFGKDKRA